jgi:hypothetical protein
MFWVDCGPVGRYCDGLTRRNFVKLGVAGIASASLADVLRARAVAKESGQTAKNTCCILIWLDGGPSHLDTYDMKPDAPMEYRGIWKPIATNVPGIQISEMLPGQARMADKFSIIRSLHHDSGDHFTGAHYLLTSRGGASGADTAGKYPSIGSIVARVCGPRVASVPPYVAIPYAMSIGLRPGYFGANYLGVPYNPFETEGDPNSDGFRVRNLDLAPGLTLARLEDRRSLVRQLDRVRRSIDQTGAMEAMDRFEQQAFELVSSERVRKAFDLSSEDPRIRDCYGRTTWGQSCLLARRLVEAGVTFVTVHMGGWDNHWDLEPAFKSMLPAYDAAVAALWEDLHARGLLERVLVVVCGEFGRTPRMNDGAGQGTPGRDHWGNAMFCLMGGGGVQGGRVVGKTSSKGEVPVDRPLKPADIHATIYHVLGVDPRISFLNPAGRPVPAIDEGNVIQELL